MTGWRRVREAELGLEASAHIRQALRNLTLCHRGQHRDPEAFEKALEEVLRAAQVAGWLDSDPSVPARLPATGQGAGGGGRRR